MNAAQAAYETLDLLDSDLLDGVLERDGRINWIALNVHVEGLSGGEAVVVSFARDMFNGTGGCTINDLFLLDKERRQEVVDILRSRLLDT